MIGHEGVRRLTEQHLRAHLPAKLDQIRAAAPPVGVDHEPDVWPPNPHVMCADNIPDRSDKFPAVMVGSSQLLSLQAAEGGAAVEWQGVYQFDVNIVVVSPQAGSDTLASIGRDRLVTAVREICIQHPDAGHGVALRCRDLTEETGPANTDSAARPLAAGVITLRAETVETIDEHSWPVTDYRTTIDVADARHNLT